MSIESDVLALVSGLQTTEPRLYQALTLLGQKLGLIDEELHPSVVQTTHTPTSTNAILPPANFAIASTGVTVRFTWDQAVNATFYEIRQGTVWDSATFILRTSGSRADIDPLVYGDYTYLIKSQTVVGTYSSDFAQVNILIPQIAAPTLSAQVIDNNILLSWTVPTSVFNIDHYIVKKDGVEIGHNFGTFATYFELVAGDYTYSIIGVDIAGNEGDEAALLITVNAPPDFSLTDSYTSDLSGTLVDVILESTYPRLLVSWHSESYEDHFVNRGYTTWQDKINAGYIPYIEPASTTGSYEERHDYGTLLNNIIVSITYNQQDLDDPVSVVVKMKVSDDDITYSAYVAGAVQFYEHFRYLKFKLEFSGTDKALAYISNVVVNISVKRENDGGSIAALSTDVGGTVVTFNKAFKSVESITVSVLSTTSYYVIYDFAGGVNPTTFKVLVFDTVGVRASKTVSWKARGIV